MSTRPPASRMKAAPWSAKDSRSSFSSRRRARRPSARSADQRSSRRMMTSRAASPSTPPSVPPSTVSALFCGSALPELAGLGGHGRRCVVRRRRGGRLERCLPEDGRRVDPAVVLLVEDGDRLVGGAADDDGVAVGRLGYRVARADCSWCVGAVVRWPARHGQVPPSFGCAGNHARRLHLPVRPEHVSLDRVGDDAEVVQLDHFAAVTARQHRAVLPCRVRHGFRQARPQVRPPAGPEEI